MNTLYLYMIVILREWWKEKSRERRRIWCSVSPCTLSFLLLAIPLLIFSALMWRSLAYFQKKELCVPIFMVVGSWVGSAGNNSMGEGDILWIFTFIATLWFLSGWYSGYQCWDRISFSRKKAIFWCFQFWSWQLLCILFWVAWLFIVRVDLSHPCLMICSHQGKSVQSPHLQWFHPPHCVG